MTATWIFLSGMDTCCRGLSCVFAAFADSVLENSRRPVQRGRPGTRLAGFLERHSPRGTISAPHREPSTGRLSGAVLDIGDQLSSGGISR
jgi:hypothetical protein